MPLTASVRFLPRWLIHGPFGTDCDADYLHLSCRQVYEEQHDDPLQPTRSPHFRREEVRGHNQSTVSRQNRSKLSSGSSPAATRSRAVPESQRSCFGRTRGPGWTTRPGFAESSNLGFSCHSHNQGLDLSDGDGALPSRSDIARAVVLLGNRFPVTGQQILERDDGDHPATSFRPKPSGLLRQSPTLLVI